MKVMLTLAFLAASLAAAFPAPESKPETIRACPPWVVTVVDAKGAPVAGARVVQEWGCDFGGMLVMVTTNAVTDAAGKLTLEARFLELPSGIGPIKELAMRLNSPDGPQPWTALTLVKSGYETTRVSVSRNPTVIWTREGLRATVVLPHWKPGS